MSDLGLFIKRTDLKLAFNEPISVLSAMAVNDWKGKNQIVTMLKTHYGCNLPNYVSGSYRSLFRHVPCQNIKFVWGTSVFRSWSWSWSLFRERHLCASLCGCVSFVVSLVLELSYHCLYLEDYLLMIWYIGGCCLL